MQSAIFAARGVIIKKEMPARAIVSLGGEYTLGPVTLGLNVHNLLGTHYYRSGMNTNLIPQQGRWFLASIGVKI
jgi:iron complex outermembrane receptor protein